MATTAIFFSWQADTPTREGRNFIERALERTVSRIGEDTSVEEAVRELAVDRDTKGVSGFPPIVDTIFRKIDRAAVFVPDLTFVGKRLDGRPTPNPNVLVEYGWALKALTHSRIVPVMNTAFGEPTADAMPFDMLHLRKPISYHCPPDADDEVRKREREQLAKDLEGAIRAVFDSDEFKESLPKPPSFLATPATTAPAFFFDPTEILARIGEGEEDEIEYRYNEQSAFYLRLIPTRLRDPALRLVELDDLVSRRKLDVLSRTLNAGYPGRNRFGAIAFEPHGTSAIPQSLSQAFPNGELWGVTRNQFLRQGDAFVVPATNVENLYQRVLANYCTVASDDFVMAPPYEIELGAVGIRGAHLGIGRNHVSKPIYVNEINVRPRLSGIDSASQRRCIEEFLDKLYDLAGEVRE
jgi:hypothetical protein